MNSNSSLWTKVITSATFLGGIVGSTAASLSDSSLSSPSMGTIGVPSSRTEKVWFFQSIEEFTSILFEHFHIFPCPFGLHTNSVRKNGFGVNYRQEWTYVVDFLGIFCRRDSVELWLSRFFAIVGNFSFDFFGAIAVATGKTSFCSSRDARGVEPFFQEQ